MRFQSVSVLLMLFFSVGCSTPAIIFKTYQDEKIIHYSKVKDIDDISAYVVYLNKGDKIPVKLKVDSEILDVEKRQLNLVLKKRVYLRLVWPQGIRADSKSTMTEPEKQALRDKTMIYISSDARQWAPYSDIKAIEKVFGIKGGSLSTGMGITQKDGLNMHLSVKMNSI